MTYVSTKSAKLFSRYQSYKFQISEEKNQNILFLSASINIENRICDVIVDQFIMKKETICQISVTCIWDIEVMTLFVQSRHIEKLIVPELLMFKDLEND